MFLPYFVRPTLKKCPPNSQKMSAQLTKSPKSGFFPVKKKPLKKGGFSI
jgi:hypothetical protein